MYQDEIETTLTSSESGRHHNSQVSLEITAYFRGNSTFDQNTLCFYCDPIGTNYISSYLKITFDDWSKVVNIRDFLKKCFTNDVANRRALSVEVKDGVASVTPYNKPANRRTELDEITIQLKRDRLEFCRSGSMHPYIFIYEEKTQEGAQDMNNTEKLLEFFDEIIASHPDFDTEGGELENPETGLLFNQQRMENLLTEFVTDSELYSDYQKAIREFKNKEYADSVRDLGRVAEILVKLVAQDTHSKENLPDNTAGKINKLDKSTDGIPSFIAKTISPLWWLRNKANHANTYEVTKNDAVYALICFQTAVEKISSEIFSV